MGMQTPPKGLLVDFGDTLVELVKFDPRAGNEALLARAVGRPRNTAIDQVMARAERVTNEITALRERFHIEMPWSTITRLIHDFVGTRFADPMPKLEIAFWEAAITYKPMPGARETLKELSEAGVPIGIVSNTVFSQEIIRHELVKHGLADHLAFVIVSSEYALRKPNVLLFDTAAAMLGIKPSDIWFVGDRLDADVDGAKQAGMIAIWFCQQEQRSIGNADFAVTNWADFLACYHRARQSRHLTAQQGAAPDSGHRFL